MTINKSQDALQRKGSNGTHPQPSESEELIDISTADDVDIDADNPEDDEGSASSQPASDK